MFLNEYEIDDYRHQYRDHAVLGPATATLSALVEAVNANSDGWPYWQKPNRAARKLQEFIRGDWPASRFDDERKDATPALLRQAYGPLRAFRTRWGVQFMITEVSGKGK
jgi:hypothetical protein